ncbi:MAG TPA: hypothetical protein VGQ53_13800 [Chitinophagaceae bacterium]|nr:hypothetical protein [Chitinophagaceae bacterium]
MNIIVLDAMEQQDIITIGQMNIDQVAAWNTLQENWKKGTFYPLLKKLNYQQDCVQCGDIYFIVRFAIDKTGKVAEHLVVREEIDCRNKTAEQNNYLKDSLLQSFYSLIFPPEFHNVIIEMQIGRVTRC